LSQKYIIKLLSDELPDATILIDQVNEEDDESDKDLTPSKIAQASSTKVDDKLKTKIKNIGISYYDTSDSEG